MRHDSSEGADTLGAEREGICELGWPSVPITPFSSCVAEPPMDRTHLAPTAEEKASPRGLEPTNGSFPCRDRSASPKPVPIDVRSFLSEQFQSRLSVTLPNRQF